MNNLILNGHEVYIQKERYASTGQTRLQAINKEDGIPYATLTTNLVDFDMPKGCVGIKNYSENKGLLPQLVQQGIVSEHIKKVPIGYIEIYICKLLM